MKPNYKFFLAYMILCAIFLSYLIFKFYREGNISSVESILKKAKKYDYFLKNNRRFGLYKSQGGDRIIFPALYINTNSSEERRRFMEEQLENYDIKNYRRVEAIEGKKIDDIRRGNIQGISFVNDYGDLSAAELACTLSHIKAMVESIRGGNDVVLILEDDCNFLLYDMWPVDSLEKLAASAPPDWEMIQLSCISRRRYGAGNTFSDKKNERSYGAASYLMNKKGIEKILDYCGFDPEKNFVRIKNSGTSCGRIPPQGTADLYLPELVRAYLYTPDLFVPSDFMFPSTIHRDHEKSHLNSIAYSVEKYLEVNPGEDFYKVEKQFIFAEVLCDMGDHLKKWGVPYMLSEGTLLGVFREEKFIENDHDIDLMIFVKDYNRGLEKDSDKFKFNKRYGEISSGYEVKFSHKKYDVPVDLFLVYSDENLEEYFWIPSFAHKVCNNSRLGLCRWRCSKFVRGEIDFAGRSFGIPGNPEKYLEERYGANWNTPVEYNYDQGINDGLSKGLIRSDLSSKNSPKESKEEDKICDLYPRKIREMAKSKPILWMYWENMPGKTKPHYLNLCYKTVEKYAGGKFHIITLSPKNIPAISRNVHKKFANISPIGMRADYVRFCVVAEYGGVWLDSDIVLLSDLSLITDALGNYDFVSFYHRDEEDVSVGIFGGNEGNKICMFYKNLFENGDYDWKNKKVKIPWTWGDSQRREFMKNRKRFGYDDFKSFYAPDTVYPVDWKNSKNYYWGKGTLDARFDGLIAVYLHNNTYSEKQKSMPEEMIMKKNLRLSDLFRKALS